MSNETNTNPPAGSKQGPPNRSQAQGQGHSQAHPNNSYVTASGGGKNAPRQIHVAHRRSQSELTSLMIEQLTLQKQLEMVQQQQQQLLAQQQQLAAKQAQAQAQVQAQGGGVGGGGAYYPNIGNLSLYGANVAASSPGGIGMGQSFIPPNPQFGAFGSGAPVGGGNYGNNMPVGVGGMNSSGPGTPTGPGGNKSRSHSRSNSGYYRGGNNGANSNYYDATGASGNVFNPGSHRRTGSQSSVYGHSRRHSLGLNEAKKAAAEEQAKRSGNDIPVFQVEDTSGAAMVNRSATPPNLNEQSGFKFPPTPINEENSSTNSTQSPRRSQQQQQQQQQQSHYRGHRYSNSFSNATPSSFKFPANVVTTPTANNDSDNDETQFVSSGRRSRSRNNEFASPGGINTNWRNQYQQGQGMISPYAHSRTSSRDYNTFNNFTAGTTLEPPSFYQSHKHRSSTSSAQSFNSFGGNSNNNNNGGNNSNGPNARKSLFAPYLPQANIPQLIQEGRLVAGILRVNKKNRSDAWVSTDGTLDADIYICGSKDRNRALEGDLVAVELLVVDEVWESKKEKEEKKRRKDAAAMQQQDLLVLDSNDDYHNDASASTTTPLITGKGTFDNEDQIISIPGMALSPQRGLRSGSGKDDQIASIRRRGSLKQRPTQKKNDDVEVEGQSLLLVEEEEINDQFKPLYAGHVVAVLDRIPGQLFSGTLGLLRPSQQAQALKDAKNNEGNENAVAKTTQPPKIAWFKPTDKKVPLIAIPTELVPKDFVENAENYSDKLFVASIKRWPITSLHPFGILLSELGEINDPNTEIDSILRDNNFLSNEYLDPKDPTKERTTFQPLELPAEELARRERFSEADGFHVVALTEASGPDFLSGFAIHLRENATDGTIELGCHTVDVTAYIESNSSLDKRARKRSSSVFMPQRVVHLLPKTLNEFFNLQQQKESATISVIFKLDAETFAVQSTRIIESVIVPSETRTLADIELGLTPDKGDKESQLLEKIATSFLSERINSPDATLLPTLSLFESLDDEKVKVDLNFMDRSLGFLIVNEIQRRVNSTVAERIYSVLGDSAFLRRQAEPVVTKIATFKKRIGKFGCDIDTSSSEGIIRSILAIKDPDIRTGVEILLFKTLSRAKYFVAGRIDPDRYNHYALNLPIYTHFTCPLRRYADHVVHRQLKAVINGIPYQEDIDALKITAEYCNFKKDCAYQAQEQAVHLILCKTINEMGDATGQLLTMATVLQVYESSFDVIIPEFGIEKRVHGDQLPLHKAEFDGVNKVLELYWQPRIDSATFVPADEKNPKSYRSSIKNKFRSTSAEIAAMEFNSTGTTAGGLPLINEKVEKHLSELDLVAPKLRLPPNDKTSATTDALDLFLNTTTTRIDKEDCIQEIRELQRVPILLRAEVGMALPCLSVRALNPFMKKI